MEAFSGVGRNLCWGINKMLRLCTKLFLPQLIPSFLLTLLFSRLWRKYIANKTGSNFSEKLMLEYGNSFL